MKIRLLLLIPAFLAFVNVNASHIIGGELVCSKIAAETYEVKLILYRDCTSLTMFDNPSYFSVFDAVTNELIDTFMVFDPFIEAIDIDSICYDTLPDVCVERATYTIVITLADLPGGYILAYQRCCRNSGIINLVTPDEAGFTVFQKIPGTDEVADNNSPIFNEYPPIVICQGDPLYIDNSATDPDGDSLVYSFFAPFEGGTSFAPMPVPASNPPYAVLINTPGYTYDYPMDASPALEINSVTGIITGTATVLGRFVVGIVVNEYRDGVLLTSHYRDFQFNVQDCSFEFVADVDEKISSCGNKQITFNNYSEGTSSYFWEFGDGDVSYDVTPTHIYTDFGTYYAKMTAEPDDVCADVAYAVVTLVESPLIATIEYDGTTLSANDADSYQWYRDGEQIDGATDQFYTPAETGNYAVVITNIEGCTDMSNEIFVEVATISVNDPAHASDVTIYPNPSHGEITITINEVSGNNFTVEIFNTAGQLVFSVVSPGKNITVPLSTAGLYTIKISTGETNYVKQVIAD